MGSRNTSMSGAPLRSITEPDRRVTQSADEALHFLSRVCPKNGTNKNTEPGADELQAQTRHLCGPSFQASQRKTELSY